ncbi:MAG: GTP-binding protein [archaeon]|nr:GTP-binding protein [archaeon]
MENTNKYDYKILITGFFNAGKTTLIHTLDPNAISIEKSLSKSTKHKLGIENQTEKTHTTVGFDRGSLCWLRPNFESNSPGILITPKEYFKKYNQYQDWDMKLIELKGVPGQIQYKIVRNMLSKSAQGIICLIDGVDTENIGNALVILEETRLNMKKEKPLLIVANKSDHKNYKGIDFFSEIVGEDILSVCATQNSGCKKLILEVLERIELALNRNGIEQKFLEKEYLLH